MPVFPSQRAVHRRERRFLRKFFFVMGLLAIVFAALLVSRAFSR
jgi:hypothetical protein